MVNNSFDDPLLFGWVDRVNVASAVQLGLTAIVTFVSVKHFIDVNHLITAFVLVQSLIISFYLRMLRMESAVTHLCNWVVLLTPVAPDKVQI